MAKQDFESSWLGGLRRFTRNQPVARGGMVEKRDLSVYRGDFRAFGTRHGS
jgi:hypothetical protein